MEPESLIKRSSSLPVRLNNKHFPDVSHGLPPAPASTGSIGQSSAMFVFFGCWNDPWYSLKQSKGVSPRDLVLSGVYDAMKKNAVQALVVAGDNVYGHKVTTNSGKQTTYYANALNAFNNRVFSDNPISGQFVRLFALGNHNVEHKNVYQAIRRRLEPFKHNVRATYTPGPLPYDDPLRFYPHLYTHIMTYPDGNACVAFVVIDTNVFDDMSKDMILMYRAAFGLTGHVDHTTLLSFVSSRIHAAIRNAVHMPNLKHLVIVGHHPIAYFDHKEGNKGNLKTDLKFAHRLILAIRRGLEIRGKTYKYVTYMCADRHNYQKSQLSFQIPGKPAFSIAQVVAGTGGAQPDIFERGANERITINATELKIGALTVTADKSMVSNSYGFCLVRVGPDGRLRSNYVKVSLDPDRTRVDAAKDDIVNSDILPKGPGHGGALYVKPAKAKS